MDGHPECFPSLKAWERYIVDASYSTALKESESKWSPCADCVGDYRETVVCRMEEVMERGRREVRTLREGRRNASLR